MKLIMTATNRPEAAKRLPTQGKDVWYDHEAKEWKSRPWGVAKPDTLHPVDIGQGVC